MAWIIIADLKKDESNEKTHGYVSGSGMQWDGIG
jgi:hypothetical protein